jgi:hypothetical protein
MELNFTEIYDGVNNIESQPSKYWEQQSSSENSKKSLKPKKKKVSFDDILSNMNLVVNQNGTLQHMSSNQESYNQNMEQQYQNQNMNNQSHVQYQYPIQVQIHGNCNSRFVYVTG